MRRAILLACLALVTVAAHADDGEVLKAKMQALMDAVAPGDKTPWTAILDKRFTSTDENGVVSNYDEMIAILSDTLKQPPALVAAGLPFIDPEGRLDVGDIYKQVAFWQSTGQVARDADPKSFIDLSFVQGHFNVPK